MENVLPPTRVLILEPPSLSQQVQRASLALAAGLEVVGAVTGAEEALVLITAERPDVRVVDLPAIPAGGPDILNAIRTRYPAAIILARTTNTTEGFILQAIRAGVRPDRFLKTSLSGWFRHRPHHSVRKNPVKTCQVFHTHAEVRREKNFYQQHPVFPGILGLQSSIHIRILNALYLRLGSRKRTGKCSKT